MNQRSMELITEAADAIDCREEVTAHPGYSGRGMYGSTTAGVSTDSLSSFIACVAYAAFMLGETGSDETSEEFVEDMRTMSHDQLGRGLIIY